MKKIRIPLFRQHIGWLALLLTLPAPILSEASGLDIFLENIYYDAQEKTFPLLHNAWFNAVFHDGLRTLLLFIPLAAIYLFVLGLIREENLRILPRNWRNVRMPGYLIVATLSGPALVGFLKDHTTHVCPSKLSLYGGLGAYQDIWSSPLFTWSSAGHCFPGGHASGGFAILAFVPLLDGKKRSAMVAVGLGMGLLMGWSRMMQGLHFLSHNLWSAWICWACILLAYRFILAPHAEPQTASLSTTVENSYPAS
jgi:membrane-associated PAP2 superfamily phosphatase